MATAATATAATAVSRTFTFFWNHVVSHPPEPQLRDGGDVSIFLQPRPFARFAGVFALVPLLPRRPPNKPLPTEVWRRILSTLIDDGEDDEPVISKPWVGRQSGGKAALMEDRSQNAKFKWNLALVSKEFKVSFISLVFCIKSRLGIINIFFPGGDPPLSIMCCHFCRQSCEVISRISWRHHRINPTEKPDAHCPLLLQSSASFPFGTFLPFTTNDSYRL